MKTPIGKLKSLSLYFSLYRLWFIFIFTGMLQMILGRWAGVHNGLEHMVFNYWWQYALEGLFYSLCHAGIYHWFKNGS
jgi:hypothetical protein